MNPQEVLRLAQLVAEPEPHPNKGAMLISPENVCDGWSGIEEAAASGRPFAVVLRSDLIVGDFDTDDGIENALSAAREIESKGLSLPVVVSSGRKGHAHLWCSTTNPEEHEIIAEILKAHKSTPRQGKGGRTRPPCSPHRQGHEVGFIYPETISEVMERLRPPQKSAQAKPKAGFKEWTASDMGEVSNKDRPQYILDTLTKGWSKGERSEGLLKLAASYKAQGFTPSDFISDVIGHPRGAGEKVARRRDRQKYLTNTWDKADPSRISREDNPINNELDKIQLAADSTTDWGKRTDHLRLTLNCIIEMARKTGKIEIHLSARTIADEAGLGAASTGSRHIKKLVERGWLERVRGYHGAEAAIYKLKSPTSSDATLTMTPHRAIGGVRVRVFHELTLDALRGRHGARVMLDLLQRVDGKTVSELADLFNKRPGTIRYHLRRFRQWGLIDWADRGPVRLKNELESSLDELAELRGTKGAGQRQRQRHADNRIGFRRHLLLTPGLLDARRRRADNFRSRFAQDRPAPTTGRGIMPPLRN